MGFSDVLKKAWPFIATASSLGGPLGEIGASALGKIIGADVKPGDLANKLSALATSEQGRLQLDAAEKGFQETMTKMGFENAEALAKIAAEDRASARAMQTQVRSWIPGSLAVFVTIGFFGILMLMFKYQPPAAAHDALMLMLGSLATAWISVVTYYFGSSDGSARKTEIMANGNAKAS
jgi:hypothetical protein